MLLVLSNLLPLAAAAFAVPQFVPQLRKARRGHVAGVSPTWVGLTCISNMAWIAYFSMTGLHQAILASAATAILTFTIAVMLVRASRATVGRALLVIAAWAASLIGLALAFGESGLGLGLSVAFIFQAAPSVSTAWRSDDVSGISAGTWWLIFGELSCFGLFGLVKGDMALQLLGSAGLIAATLMLVRLQRAKPISGAETVLHTA